MASAEEFGQLETDQEAARLVCKDRPEIAACLDGLVFRGQEEATSLLLRAALVNVSARILGDFEQEESVPAFVGDLQVQAMRLVLAGKALERELQVDRDPQARSHPRTWGYSAEIGELLHGPLPPLELNREEREVVVRRANASLESEAQIEDDDAKQRIAELQAILEDAGGGGIEESSCLIARLPRPRFAEWLARWVKESQGMPTDSTASSDVSLLSDIGGRLSIAKHARKGISAKLSPPIFPRSAM